MDKDNVSQIRAELVAALLRHGQAELGKHLKMSDSELSKKINDGSGWKLSQIAEALEFVGAQVVVSDGSKVVVSAQTLDALRTLARQELER